MGPNFRSSAMSFVWPTTVSRHFGLLAFACMAVFGVEWSIIRRDDSILSHSTSFEASNSAFLAVASWSGISQHGSFTRVYCPVALEFFHCSALLCLRFLCVFTQLLGLSCAGFYVRELWCFLRISNFVSSPLFGWIPRFGLLFPSLCVLIGLCGGSFYCSALYTPQTFAWFLVLAATCLWFCFSLMLDCMLCCLKFKCLHSMLLLSCLSTSHGLRRLLLMLCSVQLLFQLREMLSSLCFCSVRLLPSRCSFAFPTSSLDACIPITYKNWGWHYFLFLSLVCSDTFSI